MFYYQAISPLLYDFSGGVLKCGFIIAGLNSSSARANKDVVYTVLLGEGVSGAYRFMMFYTNIGS